MGQTFSNSTTATDSEQKAPGPHTDMSTPAPAPAAAAAASSSEQKEHDSYLDHIHGHQTTHIVLVTDGAVSDQPKASREFGSLCNTLFTRTSNFQADQNIYANLLVNKNNEPIALDIPHQPLQRLVLLLDTSGSMINEDRLTHLKSYIEHQFQQEAVPTHVTVITFSTAAHIVFNQRISPDVNPAEYIQSILEQIQNLRTSGCTNLHCAFEMLNTLITSEERSGLASLSIVGISTDSKIAPIGTVEKIKPFVREEYHPALQTMWSMAQNSFIDSSATRRRFVQQDIKRSAPSFVPMATLIPRASSLNRAVLGGPMGSLILSAELLQGSIHEEQSLYGWPLMQSESITSMKKHPALIKEFHSIEKDIKHTCKKIPDIQKNIQKTKASIDQSTMPAKDTDGVYAGLDEVIDYVHDVIRQDDLYLFLDINFCNRLVRESCEEPPIITRLINSDSAAFYNMNTLPSQLFPEEGNIWDVENADAPLSTNEWYTEDHVNTLKTRQLLFLCFNILSTEGDHFSMLNIVREMILNAKYPEETLPVDNQGYDVSPTTDEKKETSQSASATPQPIPLTDPFLLFCFLKKVEYDKEEVPCHMFRLFLHAMHIERLSDQDAHDLIQQHMGSFPDTSAEAARSRLEKLTRQQNELQTHANKITETEIIKKILVGKLSFIALAPQHRANFLNILRLEESRHLVFCADEAQNRVGYFLRCYKHRTLPATTPQNEDAKSTEITPKRISLPSRVERLITSFLIGADSENLPHTNARVTPTAVCLEEAEKTSSVSRLFISECTRILQMAEEVSLYLDTTPSDDLSHNRRALVSHCMARGAESSMVG